MVGAATGATGAIHGIDAVNRRKMRGERRTAPAHRFEIGTAGTARPFCSRIRTCGP